MKDEILHKIKGWLLNGVADFEIIYRLKIENKILINEEELNDLINEDKKNK